MMPHTPPPISPGSSIVVRRGRRRRGSAGRAGSAGRLSKRAVALVGLVAVVLGTRAARSDDDACIAAAEGALSLRKQEQIQGAITRLAGCLDPACPVQVRSVCDKRLSDFTQVLPTIVLVAKDTANNDLIDVKVTVDGTPLTDRLDGRAWKVDPGPHVFRFEAASFVPATKALVLGEGEKERHESIVLTPISRPADGTESARPQRTAAGWNGWKTAAAASGIAGLAGLGLGAGFGWAALQASRSQNSVGCMASCNQSMEPPAQRDHERAITYGLVADVGFGVGGAAILGAILLWNTGSNASAQPSHPRGALGVSASIESSGGSVTLSGSFE
jgi:hypothetical protein